MSATNAAANAILDLIFTAITWADVAEEVVSSPATAFFVSLHTADPTETGTQVTSEAAYPAPYARQSVARTTGGWAVTGTDPANVDNVAAITFPECTSGSETSSDFGIGENTSGAGNLYFFGALDSDLIVSTNVQPEFAIGALNVTWD